MHNKICQRCGTPFLATHKRYKLCSKACVYATLGEKFAAIKSRQDRFEERIIVTPACWIWTGAKDKHGYGRFHSNGKHAPLGLAHRYSYELYVGPIQEGLQILHKCDNRACINPEHLFVGTHVDNMRDMKEKKRGFIPAGEKHPHAKLTEQIVLSIRADSRAVTDIAKDHGISCSCVYGIKRGYSWKHLTEAAL